MALKHYVCFLSPGSLFPNEQTVEVSTRDSKFEVPQNCFAYYFFDREEIELERNGELLVGRQKNKSGRFYFGEIMTAEDIKNSVPDSEILLSNMRINGWDKVIRTRMGNFQPLEKDDTVVATSQSKFNHKP